MLPRMQPANLQEKEEDLLVPYLPGRPYTDYLFESVDFLDPNGVRTVNQIETGNVVKTFTGELFFGCKH
jgi:hypothetical protein